METSGVSGVSKRNMIIGSALLIGGAEYILSGSSKNAATALIKASSLLYTECIDLIQKLSSPIAIGAAGSAAWDGVKFIVTSIDDLIQVRSDDDYNKIERITEKYGLNLGPAMNLAKSIGVNNAISFFEKEVDLLIQKNLTHSNIPINVFGVHVKNDSDKERGGQVFFKVLDIKTGSQEGRDFESHSLIVKAKESRVVPLPIRFDFMTPGAKEIIVKSKPNDVEVYTNPIIVLPVAAIT